MELTEPATAAEQLLRLCARRGVRYIFSNLGSDHPAFISAFAKLSSEEGQMPHVVVCPHEMTTLSAAHGYAMVTRQPQVVLVHVDVGTQNLGASVHNAARGRVPALVVAGLSPVSTNRDRLGHRNEYIHYVQDAPRQHAIVDQYMKWSYELRDAQMTEGVVSRALQIATSAPQGPVYLTGAREVWDEASGPAQELSEDWPVMSLGGLSACALSDLHAALVGACRPIVVTTYLGANRTSAAKLVELSERYGFGVVELGPHYVNFPGQHPHHLGYQRNSHVADADFILLLDVDVPWLEAKVSPSPEAKVVHIDLDPLKVDLGYWHFPVQRSHQADSGCVLDQLLELEAEVPSEGRRERGQWIAEVRAKSSPGAGSVVPGTPITVAELTLAVRSLVNERTIVLVEAPSAAVQIASILRMSRPGSYFQNHGAGLGWGANAAIGVKLADPDAEVITLLGDGCFLFSVPSSAYWVAGTYATPHLTVIYNNGGWRSPRLSTVAVHPQGPAEQADRYWVGVGAGANLAKIAEATGGAVGYRVEHRDELMKTLEQALATVRSGQSAVVDVRLERATGQVLA